MKSHIHGKERKLEEQRGGIGNVCMGGEKEEWEKWEKEGNRTISKRKQADNVEEGNQKGNEKIKQSSNVRREIVKLQGEKERQRNVEER